MSRASLTADALRTNTPLERSRRKLRPPELREGILYRVYGPGFPGFAASTAEIVDRHITHVVDCSNGIHGKVLAFAMSAYRSQAEAAAEMMALVAGKRRRPYEVARAADQLNLWLSIARAGQVCYATACTIRGMPMLDVLPEPAETPIKLPLPPRLTSDETVEQRFAALHVAIEKVREHVAALLPRPNETISINALGRTISPGPDPSIKRLVRLEEFEGLLIAAHKKKKVVANAIASQTMEYPLVAGRQCGAHR